MTAEQLINSFVDDGEIENGWFDIGDESGLSEDEVMNDYEWEFESEDKQSGSAKSPNSSPGKLAIMSTSSYWVSWKIISYVQLYFPTSYISMISKLLLTSVIIDKYIYYL